MSAGLPGLGLGGLFFILSALFAPVVELRRTLRGESSVASWRRVGRQFTLAVAMIVAVDLALRLTFVALGATGLGESRDGGVTVLPLLPIGITAGLLATVLAGAKAWQLAASARSRGLPPLSVPPGLRVRPRVLASAAGLTVAWSALLFVGAAQLSPVSDPSARAAPRTGAGIGSLGDIVALAEGQSGGRAANEEPAPAAATPAAGRRDGEGAGVSGPSVVEATGTASEPYGGSSLAGATVTAASPSDGSAGPGAVADHDPIKGGATGTQPAEAGAPTEPVPPAPGPPAHSNAPDGVGPPQGRSQPQSGYRR
jgi:hypothetical protein